MISLHPARRQPQSRHKEKKSEHSQQFRRLRQQSYSAFQERLDAANVPSIIDDRGVFWVDVGDRLNLLAVDDHTGGTVRLTVNLKTVFVRPHVCQALGVARPSPPYFRCENGRRLSVTCTEHEVATVLTWLADWAIREPGQDQRISFPRPIESRATDELHVWTSEAWKAVAEGAEK